MGFSQRRIVPSAEPAANSPVSANVTLSASSVRIGSPVPTSQMRAMLPADAAASHLLSGENEKLAAWLDRSPRNRSYSHVCAFHRITPSVEPETIFDPSGEIATL